MEMSREEPGDEPETEAEVRDRARERRYFLKWGEAGAWTEVSRSDFAAAESAAGFKPEWDAEPGELATGGFGSFNMTPGVYVEGRTTDRDTPPCIYATTDPEFCTLVWGEADDATP